MQQIYTDNYTGFIQDVVIVKAIIIGRVEKTDPRSADYPLTPAPRTTLRTTPRTTLRTTLKNQPNSFYGVQKYQKRTCSSYTIITARKTAAIFFSYISRPSLFHFAPFFTGRPPARTLFPQWTIGKRCWIFIFVICLKCLPSTLTFANKQLFWIFLPSRD